MTSIFPALLDFSLLGIFVLRVITGLFYIMFGLYLLQTTHILREKSIGLQIFGFVYGTMKCTVGALLTLGVFIQPAAIGGMFLAVLTYAQGYKSASKSVLQVQTLLFFICLSLLFLGPGTFAFDLPL